MINVLNIIDKLNEKSESLREWISKYSDNPFFWIIIFGVGVAIFFFTYNALQTEK